MPARRRIRTHSAGGGGGGGPPGSAVVRWGPNFGTPGGDSLPQKSTLALTRVEEIVALGQVHTLGGQLRAAYTSGPGQVHTLGGTIGPSYSGPGQAQAIRHAQLALAGALGQVQSVRHTALALSGGVAQVQAVRHPELALSGGVAQVQATRHTALALVGGIGQVQATRHTALALAGGVAQVQALAGKARGAPFWQSVGTKALATTLGATQIVANMPSGIVAGDLLVAFVCVDTTADAPLINTPSGWTIAGAASFFPGVMRGAVFTKTAVGGDTLTVTFSGSTLRATVEVHRVNGQDSTTPVNATAEGNASVIDPIVPAVTTTVANCLVFTFVGHRHAAAQTHDAPAGHVERTQFADTNVNLLDSSSYTRIFAAAASTGTATVDCNELVASGTVYHRVAIAPGDLVF